MEKQTSRNFKGHMRKVGASSLAIAAAMSQVVPTFAAIDNTATATGTYSAAPYNSNASPATVPVVTAAPALTTTKSAGVPTTALGTDTTISDVGDTITYTYTIKNTGNVTLTGVTPVDAGPTFNGSAGTGSLAAFSPASASLAPNATQVFTAVYTMSQLDVDRSAGVTANVSNTATATGTPPIGAAISSPGSTATTTIPAGPKLKITKQAVLNDTNGTVAGRAEVGETIAYTYLVENVGNVTLTGVSVADTHEGALLPAGTVTNESLTSDGPLAPGQTSTDATAANGIWSVLRPGAKVTFTYVHTVTLTEVNNG